MKIDLQSYLWWFSGTTGTTNPYKLRGFSVTELKLKELV